MEIETGKLLSVTDSTRITALKNPTYFLFYVTGLRHLTTNSNRKLQLVFAHRLMEQAAGSVAIATTGDGLAVTSKRLPLLACLL
jgi:hypothetical protein